MNKNEFVNEISKERLESMMRSNVIVMGDIIEDIDMVTPENHNQVLKIGFLNSNKNEHLLENYQEHFDIVISRDGPMLPVNMVLDAVN